MKLIEINLLKLERGLRKEKVKVTRNGKITYEYRRVGRKEKEKDLASQLKIGDSINFRGKESEVTRINPVTHSIELDNKISHTPKEINKYGEIDERVPEKVEEKESKVEPKIEEKPKELIIQGLNKPEEVKEEPKIEEDVISRLKVGSKLFFMGTERTVEDIDYNSKQVTIEGKKFSFELVNKIGKIIETAEEKKIRFGFDVEKEDKKITDYSNSIGKKGGKYEKMTEGIEAYTTHYYEDMNAYLRDPDAKIVLGKEDVEKYNKGLSDFIDGAPKVSGTFYRGMKFNKEYEKDTMNKFLSGIEKIGVGNVLELKSFTSTSPDKKVADIFSGDADDYGILLKIKTNKGIYLTPMSAVHTEEILINKNSKFIIKKYEKGTNSAIIELEEK